MVRRVAVSQHVRVDFAGNTRFATRLFDGVLRRTRRPLTACRLAIKKIVYRAVFQIIGPQDGQQTFRQVYVAVFSAFAFNYPQLFSLAINVRNSQRQGLAQTQTRAVQQGNKSLVFEAPGGIN